MKKGLIAVGVLAIFLIGAIIALATMDFNRMGKDNAYYQIPAESSVEETKLESGEIMKRYLYTGTAYKENGESIEVEFSAAKELREGAYLKLYLKNGDEVTSYDEVQPSDIPEKVKF
ncbi:YxeA family protein [Sporosarcina koreensis]|uniref:YxeA family protein n=1 Tax=Sporosarcina koreensis TaxID=334735 RepID=UPI0007568258|nr:YxeA family protein [Sporosarcina koreensis]